MGIEAGSSTYYQAKRGIVQNGLVLHLDAGVKESYRGGNYWYDLSGNNSTFNLDNGAVISRTSGGSIFFDGTNDYATRYVASTPSLLITGDKTIMCWHYRISGGGDSGGVLVRCGRGSDLLYSLFHHSSGYIYYHWYDAGFKTVYSPTGGNDAPMNTWLCSCITVSGTSLKFYINGSYIYAGTVSAPSITSAGNLNIGSCWGNTSQDFYGYIPIVLIYDTALSADEVSRNYNATRHRFGL